MPITTENILTQIKQIRKSKRIKIHDCATILSFPKETYLGIEEGIAPLTLPELELLAIYFGVKPSVFFNLDHPDFPNPSVLNEDIRPQFKTLRGKMIRATLRMELDNKVLSLADIEAATHIPVDILQQYFYEDLPIPLFDLITISSFLDLPIDTLFDPIWEPDKSSEISRSQEDWQPEFVNEETQETALEEESYQDLYMALSRIPKEDQAQIAKILLEKLKSL